MVNLNSFIKSIKASSNLSKAYNTIPDYDSIYNLPRL